MATGVSLTPTLDWQDSTDAATYTLLIDDDSDFLSPFVDDATLTTSDYTVGAGALAAGVTYYWRVTAVNGPQQTPASNNDFSFTTAPLPGTFSLLTPASKSADVSVTPTLDWEDSSDAATYTLVIDDDPAFGSPLVNDDTLVSSEYTVGAALAAGVTYHWQVKAVNATGETSASNNDFSFTTTPVFTDVGAGLTGVRNGSLAWGDYDGDGNLDIASTGMALSATTNIHRNDGGGVFVEIPAGLAGLTYSSLAWGDYDNDGDLDLALVGFSGGWQARLYRNDGGGTFVEIPAGLEGADGCSLAWGDYDNDGDLDLALAGYTPSGNITKVYRNDGPGGFVDTAAGLTGVRDCSLAWGDYDNDGDLDIALAGYAQSSPVTSIYRNDGGGTFVEIPAGLTAVDRCSLAWGDYDNDADLDLALAGDTGSGYVSTVYRNDGAGVFTDIGAGLTGVRDCSLAWGDYDNDGDLDLALAGDVSAGPHMTIVYINQGADVFADSGAVLPGVYLGSLAWGDYDNDGDLDLALSGDDNSSTEIARIFSNDSGTPNTVPDAPSGLTSSVSAGVATLSWSAATDTQTPSEGLSYNLRVGTTPGDDDAFSGMADPSTGLRRLPATGNAQQVLTWDLDFPGGTYYWSVQAVDTAFAGSAWADEESFVDPGPGAFSLLTPANDTTGLPTTPTLTWEASLNAATYTLLIDDDPAFGSPEVDDATLITNNYTVGVGALAEGITYYWRVTAVNASGGLPASNGDFSFTTKPFFGDIGAGLAGLELSSAAWGDYDNDGDLDIAVAGLGVGEQTTVYRNDGGGTFFDISAGLKGVGMSSLAWGDYDNDGDLDLAVAGSTGIEGVSSIYRNDGPGGFTDIGAGLTGVYLCSLAWGDYDNDGDLDLALAGFTGGSRISNVYRNDGGGVFTDIAAGLQGVNSCSVAWGDYDNDGDLDLALAGFTGGPYASRIYSNDGGDSFTDIGAGLTAVTGASLAWGDYDNDGYLDLALSGYASSGRVAKLYHNEGVAGTFVETPAGLTAVDKGSLAWGDYDNDGDLDLALTGDASTGPHVAIVYRNEGAGVFTDISAGLTGVRYGSLVWGDYDNEGDLDLLLTGQPDTFIEIARIYSNDFVTPNTVPGAPSGLSSSTIPGAARLTWLAATDTETPPAGLSYNIRVGTTPGGEDAFCGMADLSTGLRRLPATGNAQKVLSWDVYLPGGMYYWSVQAVDTAFAASAWPDEEVAYVPGITVSPASGLVTTESGGQATFTVVLDAPPTDIVTIGLSISLPGEGSVSPTSVIFDAFTWDTPQPVIVTGQDDALDDGNVPYTIFTDPAVSADGAYGGLDGPDVSVTNVDDETPLSGVAPPGSLIYRGSASDAISAAGETDIFLVKVDPGQTITVVVEPDPALQPVVQLSDPGDTVIGSATPAVGVDAVIQTVPDAGAGTYKVTVGGGGTTGPYAVTMILNAAVEMENHGGSTNDTSVTAQSIDASFISLGGGARRGAVLSESDPIMVASPDFFSFTLAADESATMVLTSLSGPAPALELYDGLGARVATGSAGPANVDFVIDDFVAPAAGTYVIAASSNLSDYTVVVTVDAAFDLEPNDDLAGAQDIGGRTAALGHLPSGQGRLFITPGITDDISEIHPETGAEINSFPAPVPPDGFADGLAFDGHSLFFMNGFGPFTLWELDPDTGGYRDDDPIPTPGLGPLTGLAALGGMVYVLDEWDFVIWRFDPDTDVTDPVPLDPGMFIVGGLSGMSTPDDALIAFDAISSWVVEIHPVTGASTPLFPAPWPSGIAVIDGTICLATDTAPGPCPVERYAPDGTPQGSFLPPIHISALGGDDVPILNEGDWFSFPAADGDNLTLATATPADGGGEFANVFDPALELYNPSGGLVASDDNSVGDGRNAELSWTVPAAGAGVYTARVLSADGSAGEYVLTVAGATAGPEPFEVTSTYPADGATVDTEPFQLTVHFNDAVYIPSLAASDLTVGGGGATGFTVVDADTVAFDFDALTAGVHDVEILGDAIRDLQGTSVSYYLGSLTVAALPNVVSSTVAEGAVLPAGDLTCEVQFDLELDAGVLDATDFSLTGASVGAVAEDSWSYDAPTSTLTIDYTGLAEDSYTLTLLSGDDRFEDVAGRDLDGAPSWPLPSGDAVEGGDFSLSFSLEIGTMPFPTPLAPVPPLGGLVYGGSLEAAIGEVDDVDNLTIDLEAGQTVTVLATPDSALQPSVELFDPSMGSVATASGAFPGDEAMILDVSVATAGVYTVTVSSDGAATSGDYELQIILNAAVEAEEHGGASNDSPATAQLLGPHFVNLGGVDRAAVLGTANGPILNEDFEAGLGGFTIDNTWGTGTVDGLWHVSTGYDSDPGHSAPTSLYFGQGEGVFGGGDYDVGHTSGAVYSPPIALPAGEPAFLTFSYLLDLEFGADVAEVAVDDGTGYVMVLSTADSSLWPTGPGWSGAFADLAPFAGSTITLRFSFDTQNAFDNLFEGWYIDDVRIEPWAGPMPDYYAVDMTAGESASFVVAGVPFALYDAFEAPIVAASSDATNASGIINGFVAPATDTYYVGIPPFDLVDYDLVVVRGAVFDAEPNDDLAGAQPLGPGTTAVGEVGSVPFGDDYYSFAVAGDGDVTVTTATPGDGAGEFVNALDPAVEVYDWTGAFVGGDDNGDPDGRNADLALTGLAAGTYTVRVYASLGSGDYTLTVAAAGAGTTVAPPSFEVVATDPADGATVEYPPAQLVVDFSSEVLFSSVDPGDLLIDSITSPTGFLIVDGNTVAYDLPVLATGPHTFEIVAGEVTSASGTPVVGFPGGFTVLGPPRVVASSIQQNDVRPPGALTVTVEFDRDMDAAVLDTSDFRLTDQIPVMVVPPAGWGYDGPTRTLTVDYTGLVESDYIFRLFSGDGQFEDIVGRDLDGEPNWPLPSGDGAEGGVFFVNFSLDMGTMPFPTPLAPVPPLGGLVYDGSLPARISHVGDEDTLTLDVDAGQTITVVVDPGIGLQPEIEITDPTSASMGVATAAGSGQDAVFQTAGPTVDGTYTVRVATVTAPPGAYTVRVILNAAVETEEHDGPPNDAHATAQDLTGSFVSVGGTAGRYAVIGRSLPSDDDWYCFPLVAGDSATVVANVLAAGSISVELYDPAGALLAAGAGAGNVDQAISGFEAPVDGLYRALVTGDDTEYCVVVTRNAAFDLEPNDDLAGAQDVSAPTGARTVVGHTGGYLPSRLFAVPDDLSGDIVELDLDGNEINRFKPPIPPTGMIEGLAFDGQSLFFIDGGPTIWELNPDTGERIDDDPITGAGPFTGLAALGGMVYILDEGANSIIEFDPGPDTTIPLPPDPSVWLGGGLSGILAPDALVAADMVMGAFVEVDPATGEASFLFPIFGPFPSGVAVIDGEIYAGNSIGTIERYTRIGTPLGPIGLPFPTSALGGDDVPPLPADDWFSFAAADGDGLTLTTATPADGGGEFANAFDPALELYDPSGLLVASDDNNAGDGRNAEVSWAVPAAGAGVYTARVLSADGTAGEYVLTIAGATGGLAPFEVTSTEPADGAAVGGAFSQITVHFNDAVFIPSLDASDLTVDVFEATGFTVVDGNTVAFDLPALPDGTHPVEIDAGVIESVQGAPLDVYLGSLTLDATPPGDVTGLVLTPSNGQVALAWTNPPDADFAGVIVLRRMGSPPSGTPTAGATYTAGDTIGDGEVVYVGAGFDGAPGAPSGCPADTNLAGATYHYAVFAFDALLNYSGGVTDSAMCGTIIYVKWDAGGSGTGASWTDAFTSLQAALTAAVAGNQIWVAQGTYKPAGPRTDEFQLKTRVGVYGGFEGLTGQEDDFAARDWATYVTVLSGDIGVLADNSDNTYHVVLGAQDAILDGFTVRDGNASSISWPNNDGGGLCCLSVSQLTIANCAFVDNSAVAYGGGAYVYNSSSVVFQNCTFAGGAAQNGAGVYVDTQSVSILECQFTDNVASLFGGAVYGTDSSLTLADCAFESNVANGGGAVYSISSDTTVAGCSFLGNSAASRGGAIHDGYGTSDVTDCVFAGNTANEGGGLSRINSTLQLTNCAFTMNAATSRGGGVSDTESGGPPALIASCSFTGNSADFGGGIYCSNSSPIVTNCVLWGNTAVTLGPEIDKPGPPLPTVTYNCIQGGYASEGNIGELPEHDPRFVDPAGIDTIPGTLDDDLRLRSGSPCIDSADGDAAPAADLDGNPRHDDSGVVDTGVGAVTYADMGAYEFQGESVRIIMITPGVGPKDGGTVVTITGVNFDSAAEVFFDGTPAASVTYVSPTEITAETPSSSTYGPVDVRVVNPGGAEDTVPDGFTYMGGDGDLDGDGDVDWDDVAIIMANAGLNSSHPAWDPRCDPDGNNVCNLDDLMVVFRNFGNDYT
ncbi:MAG: FG-GAP-like repeat-containing protein [Planctomycetota bacterium]